MSVRSLRVYLLSSAGTEIAVGDPVRWLREPKSLILEQGARQLWHGPSCGLMVGSGVPGLRFGRAIPRPVLARLGGRPTMSGNQGFCTPTCRSGGQAFSNQCEAGSAVRGDNYAINQSISQSINQSPSGQFQEWGSQQYNQTINQLSQLGLNWIVERTLQG